MSAHIRSQIRAAIAAQLDSIPAVTERVSASRTARLDPADLPCITVGTPAEQIERIGYGAPYVYQRSITVVVDGYVSAEPLEDSADALAADVERTLAAAGALGGIVQAPPVLTETQIEVDDTVSPPMAMVRLAYLATAITAADTPDAAA